MARAGTQRSGSAINNPTDIRWQKVNVRSQRIPGLYPLDRAPKPHKLFAFDIETCNDNKDFVVGAIVGDNYKRQFLTRKAFFEELTHNKIFRNSWIFATNLTFDLGAIFEKCKHMLQSMEIIMRGSDFVVATTFVKHNAHDTRLWHPSLVSQFPQAERNNFDKLTFCDTLSHFKGGVNDMGAVIGLPKLQTPSYIGDKPHNKKEWAEMMTYNLRDAEVSYEFMKWLQSMYNELGASLKYTAPSTSIDLFRRKFMSEPWFQPPRENIIESYNPYYGGRTEAFKRGHYKFENYGKVQVYDVNALYPYVMKEFEYPMPWKFEKRPSINKDGLDSIGFGEFELKAPKDMYIPILPVKTDKLLFPSGHIKGWYDFYSVKFALDNGYELLSSKNCTVYTDRYRPFEQFVTDLYKKRLEYKAQGNNAQMTCKLMMNSLYGKWGQRFNNKERIMLAEYCDDSKARPYDDDIEVVKTTTNDDSRISGYIFPVLSSCVTAYARIHLYQLFSRIGQERVMYCDTDSVFTTRVMSSSDELGDIKLEKSFENCLIVKPKMYGGILTGGQQVIKIKGMMKSRYIEDPYGIKNYETLIKQAEEGVVHAKLFRFLKFKQGLHSGHYINQPAPMDKSFDLNDTKRQWANAWNMKPEDSNPIQLSKDNYSTI